MTADLFNAGFAWGDDEGLSQPDATGDATRPSPASASGGARPGHAYRGDVAGVATVAETEGQRLERMLSQSMVARVATPDATAETAVFRGVEAMSAWPVADVASVANWSLGVGVMRAMAQRPPHPHHGRWSALCGDAAAFIEDWAADAVAAGWGTLDVFGTNPEPRHRRVDRLGLIALLGGRPIQSLDADSALIGEGANLSTFYRRLRSNGAVPLWTISAEVFDD